MIFNIIKKNKRRLNVRKEKFPEEINFLFLPKYNLKHLIFKVILNVTNNII